MRSFIALDIPSEVTEIIYMKGSLFRGFVEGSFVKKEHIHATLFFFEDFKGDIDKVNRYLASISCEIISKLTKLSFFSRKNYPAVLYAEFDPTNVQYIYDEMKSFLLGLKIPFDDKPFKSHITICRIKKIRDMDKFYAEVRKGVDCVNFKFPSITFYQSTLTPNGPLYNIIFRKELL
ncbi:MAG: RNA 2',3'-cyclic phosphodiesterase [Deferribacterales bacterium]